MKPELIKIIKEKYHSGVSIRLISMEKEPQMPEGLMGKVDFVDDAGQIHVQWDNGSTLALVCGVDRFFAFEGPATREFLYNRLYLNDDTKTWYRSDFHDYTVDAFKAIDTETLIAEAERFLEVNSERHMESINYIFYPFNTESNLSMFLLMHVFSDTNYMNFINKADYAEYESEAGKCPKCGYDDIEFGSSEIEDEYVKYEWTCPKCESEGNELGKIVFDGHYVDSSPYFKKHEKTTPVDKQTPPNYSIIEDNGIILATLLSKFTVGNTLEFYQNYDEETGETDGVYSVKMIREFDSTVLLFNYCGGGAAYVIDMTWDEEADRFKHIKDRMNEYFDIIGFNRIYVRLEQ